MDDGDRKDEAMTDSITIRARQGATRTFELRATDPSTLSGSRPGSYLLTGARGAVYAAVRYINQPTMLHVIDLAGNSPLGGVILSDEGGTLEQVR